MKSPRPFLVLLAVVFAMAAAGCSGLPIAGPLPAGLAAEKIARIDEGSTEFAISPDGKVAAFADSGLKLILSATGERVAVSPTSPRKLAWSPSGEILAAVYRNGEKSSIITYDRRGGRTAETGVEGVVTDLAWLSERELIAGALLVTRYKFGSNYKSIIHRWQPGSSAPVNTTLRDSTLQPRTTARWQALLDRGPMLDLSASHDYILYLHPYDPPLLTPYYRLILRELATGREMEIANQGLTAGGGRFSADGETILYGDGMARTTVYDPWTEETLGSRRSSGQNLELSPAGSYWFADGVLFVGDAPVASLTPGAIARFSPDGRELFVAGGGILYRLSGLNPDGKDRPAATRPEKLRQLRSWRLEGLISAIEYREAIERLKLP
jgi:hypothetical protein